MKLKISKYWLCQISGWSTYIIIYTFFYLTLHTEDQPNFFKVLFLDVLIGIFITHLMRLFIQHQGLLLKEIQRQILLMFLTTLVASFFCGFLGVVLEQRLDLMPERLRNLSIFNLTIRATFGSFLFLIIWNLIYFTYHYVLKSQQEMLDKVKLQSLVKELELKTIKAHINPHFIFNALNSIKALVDENPVRARQAIIELSNLLRSSLQAEKVEAAPLERELDIVKNYLALEHIRFEHRLVVEFDIDEDTLGQHLPPMMLQTLVENAIKHGISKLPQGGVVHISSDFIGDHHELVVKNTGHLNGSYNPNGFGISSTLSRLSLMYGDKAHFEIKNNAENNMVIATIIMPVFPL